MPVYTQAEIEALKQAQLQAFLQAKAKIDELPTNIPVPTPPRQSMSVSPFGLAHEGRVAATAAPVVVGVQPTKPASAAPAMNAGPSMLPAALAIGFACLALLALLRRLLR
jgi:hypothetical protein